MPLAIETQGLHPSTALCLEALQWLHEKRDFSTILDMGCGNGILSVAAAAIWDANVLAVDVSEKALKDAEKNLSEHAILEQVTLLRSDGFTEPLIRKLAPYDLLLCNMLAEFTVETARHIKAYLADDGIAILAGILAWKAEMVETAYKSLGFEIIKQTSNSPWQCYVIGHASAAHKGAIVTKP